MSEDKQQYQTVLLLGNGFDLHYKLLTRYQDFLLTTAFLAKQDDLSQFKTYADLLECGDLLSREDCKPYSLVRENWERYTETYRSMGLPQDEIRTLASMAKENVWFRYLLMSFNQDVGWIDFEKEIAFVLGQFKVFFSRLELSEYVRGSGNFVCHQEQCFPDAKSWYVVSRAFPLFIREEWLGNKGGVYEIKRKYILEEPKGSGQYILNQEKIIGELYTALRQLAAMLEVYLQTFADKVFLRWWMGFAGGDVRKRQKFFWRYVTEKSLHSAVVFNYTHTFDLIWGNKDQVAHLHGGISGKNCVLGINPDEDDHLDSVNTDFLQFKKYFQRVFYGTDLAYLKAIEDLRNYKADRNNLLGLVIMGHSLDVTDRDVIEELVNLADRITILYHTQSAVASYISNLVKIFGKEGFDTIRARKRLKFQSITEAQALAQREYELTTTASLAPV